MKKIESLPAQNNGLVQVFNNQVVTTSLKVAELFGKQHKDVLKAIRTLDCSSDFTQRNFALMVKMKELPQGGATKCEYYFISRDGFTFLVMGFTGKTAAKFKEDFINAFNTMEKLKKSKYYPCCFKNIHTFAVLQDDDCIRYVGQAVNLLNCYLGFFCAPMFAVGITVDGKLYIKYWRLPIRKIYICSRSEYNHLVAAYMAAAFLLPVIPFLNATRWEI